MMTLSTSSNSLITAFFFFIIILFLMTTKASTEPCTSAVCYKGEPVIRFPFRIPTLQPDPSCGSQGFDVSCNKTPTNMTTTLLTLPSSGQFMVQAIDYGAQEVWVNDPDGCLPRRILSLNLSAASSPFTAVYFQEFSFFNCSSSNYIKYGLNPITCLSGNSYTVFATSSYKVIGDLAQSCQLVASVPVPVQWPFYEQVLSSDLSDDLRLTWEEPRCGRCESRGGRCGFKANSTTQIVCTKVPHHGLPRAARYAITVGVGVPGLCFAAFVVGSNHTQWGATVRAKKLIFPDHQPPSTCTHRAWTSRQSSHTPRLCWVRAGASLTLRQMTSRAPYAYQITNQKKP